MAVSKLDKTLTIRGIGVNDDIANYEFCIANKVRYEPRQYLKESRIKPFNDKKMIIDIKFNGPLIYTIYINGSIAIFTFIVKFGRIEKLKEFNSNDNISFNPNCIYDFGKEIFFLFDKSKEIVYYYNLLDFKKIGEINPQPSLKKKNSENVSKIIFSSKLLDNKLVFAYINSEKDINALKLRVIEIIKN